MKRTAITYSGPSGQATARSSSEPNSTESPRIDNTRPIHSGKPASYVPMSATAGQVGGVVAPARLVPTPRCLGRRSAGCGRRAFGFRRGRRRGDVEREPSRRAGRRSARSPARRPRTCPGGAAAAPSPSACGCRRTGTAASARRPGCELHDASTRLLVPTGSANSSRICSGDVLTVSPSLGGCCRGRSAQTPHASRGGSHRRCPTRRRAVQMRIEATRPGGGGAGEHRLGGSLIDNGSQNAPAHEGIAFARGRSGPLAHPVGRVGAGWPLSRSIAGTGRAALPR